MRTSERKGGTMIGRKALALVAAAMALIPVSCSKRPEWIKTYFTLEGRTEKMDLPPSTPEELEATVRKYRKIVEEKVDAGSREAYYLRLLGSAYLARRMYGEALKAFEASVALTPANAPLFYYMGLCSGYVGKSLTGPDDAQKSRSYILAAEKNHLRALEIDPAYARSMYALAVLYAFELGRPAEAVPLAERYLEINTEDDGARFVLARAFFLTGRIDDAVSAYGVIEEKSKNPRSREDAKRNREAILSGDGARK
jgi:tetratricopeptide (TPR) repeat protein